MIHWQIWKMDIFDGFPAGSYRYSPSRYHLRVHANLLLAGCIVYLYAHWSRKNDQGQSRLDANGPNCQICCNFVEYQNFYTIHYQQRGIIYRAPHPNSMQSWIVIPTSENVDAQPLLPIQMHVMDLAKIRKTLPKWMLMRVKNNLSDVLIDLH